MAQPSSAAVRTHACRSPKSCSRFSVLRTSFSCVMLIVGLHWVGVRRGCMRQHRSCNPMSKPRRPTWPLSDCRNLKFANRLSICGQAVTPDSDVEGIHLAWAEFCLTGKGSVAFRRLLPGLRNTDPNVRYWTIEKLLALGHDAADATASLQILAQSDPDSFVRRAAQRALISP